MSGTETLAPANDRGFFGHPRGLSTLFFTEMWERFSYYGIRALLILYMTAAVDKHGMGMNVAIAGALYGLYTSCAYIFALPAGWIADRFLGHQRSVVLGGLLIAAGNFGLMLPSLGPFVGSLLLMAIGTGFLKTSCTTIVGFLYGQHDIRRDSGFTLYYVGINIGAGIAPLILGYIGQTIDYRYAFGVAGLFMLAGLIQFQITRKYLGDAGRCLPGPHRRTGGFWDSAPVCWQSLSAALLLMRPALEKVADGFGGLLLIAVVVTFGALILSKDFTPVEKKRIYVILVLFVASAIFWSIFEQAGSTLNLFADRSTDNHLFGFAFPSSWFQSLNSGFIYVLGPVAGLVVDQAGRPRPIAGHEIRDRLAVRGRRIPGDGVRRAGGRRHRPGRARCGWRRSI